jgi:nicotinamidase-related amidase
MFDFTGEKGDIEFKKGSVETEFIDGLNVIQGSITISKTRYDAFISTPLDSVLKQNSIEKVVICGFMTNFCCESTARHAHDADYFVDFVSDATGTPGTERLSPEETVQATLATLEAGYATIVATSDLL